MKRENGEHLIKGVRLSFPHLFSKPLINGQEGKYGTKGLLDPATHAKDIEALRADMQAIADEKLKGKVPPEDKTFLRSGDDTGREEAEGMIVLSANSNNRPYVMDQKKQPLTEDDNEIYSGVYADVMVRLWAQDNKFGKRINCELVAVQKRKDGEPLGGGHVSRETVLTAFDDIEDDDIDWG